MFERWFSCQACLLEPSKDVLVLEFKERGLKVLLSNVPMQSVSAMKRNHAWVPQFIQGHQPIKNIGNFSLAVYFHQSHITVTLKMDFITAPLNKLLKVISPEKFNLGKEIVSNACSRKIDDYCPRKQLERLINICGKPVMKSKEEIQCDGTTLIIPYKNVFTYVGEDMRTTAENELRRRHEIKVKAAILKQETASARAVQNIYNI